MSSPIIFTSCQAPIAERFCAGVAEYVGQRLGLAVEVVDAIPWPERLREFDAGRIHVCWMCGLPYVWRADGPDPSMELLGALVAAGARYGDRPVYFSDVLVRRDSPWSSFAGLEGATWAYNEPTSHSGYNATRHLLARMGRERGFFASAVMAGSHEASLRLLLDGSVDATAIDSTVLDLVCRADPDVGERVRSVASFGPSPSPPWVIERTVPEDLRAAVRTALLTMSTDRQGRAVLASGLVSRFAVVTDGDYDQVRRMATECARVEL
jgi:phosphate/phosphite/phosphonate ABC transporter binding protein